MEPVDIHDTLKDLRGMDPAAVSEEGIRPYARPSHVHRDQSIDLPPLCLEIETPGTFPLDSNWYQYEVTGQIASVLDR